MGMKIMVKILLKLCTSNLKPDQYGNGGIIFLIATSGNEHHNVRLLHLSFLATPVENASLES